MNLPSTITVMSLACLTTLSAFNTSLYAQTQATDRCIDSLQRPATTGVGTEMTRIVNRIGLGSDCQRCKALAQEMDLNGVDWVRKNKSYVFNKTVTNAQMLGHKMGPVKRIGVRIVIQKAIFKSSGRR